MKRQHTYERIMAEKLNGLASPDVSGLWQNMEAILDKEMPQQEKKRRFGAWWFSANMLVAASLVTAVGCAFTWQQLNGNTVTPQASAEVAANSAKVPNAATIAADATAAGDKETAPAPATMHMATAARTGGTKSIARNARKRTALAYRPSVIGGANSQPMLPASDAAQAAVTPLDDNNLSEPMEAGITTLPLAEVEPVKVALPAVFNKQEVKALSAEELKKKIGVKKRGPIYIDKGLSVGVSVNYPTAIGGQQQNDLDMSGRVNKLQDYIPSVYAQLHLNSKVSVHAEWMPVTAQYTPNFTLYHNIDEPNPDEKEEKVVKLNKLFYTSVPVSVHYNTPLKNVTVGMGVQYSLLKKVILQDLEYYHVIGANGWNIMERKNEVSVKDPAAVRSHNSGDVVDDVARSIRKEDWRLLADVGYSYKGLNAGVRFTKGLNNYVNSNFTNLQVKDKTSSLQVYLRYNVFDSRKK